MTDYLTLNEVLGMHRVLLKRYGGAEGVRDMGALEAAIYRPQTGYYQDVIEEAAALMESLIINHPFVDGNKRISFAAADVFLRINGYRITMNSDEVYNALMVLFDSGKMDYAHILKLLRDNTNKS